MSHKVCVYCGANAGTTSDHVPPANLFPPPRPSTLITVPACESCNGGFSQDDEYFRLVICTRPDLRANPAVQRLIPVTLSGLDRPESSCFKRAFLDATRAAGDTIQLRVDCDRLNRVAERTVRGLHYFKYSRVLPAANVNAFYEMAFDPPNMQPIFPLQSILTTLRKEPPTVIHSDVFEYQVTEIVGKPDASAWLLSFFTHAWFIVLANWK
jgi:hypothetical protein